MKKILFLYDMEEDQYWKDGLWAALEELKKDFIVDKYNLATAKTPFATDEYDFYLAWTSFNSMLDQAMHTLRWANPKAKIGLCLGGYAQPASNNIIPYDVIFYETEWSKKWLKDTGKMTAQKLIHAFGVNTEIYYGTDSNLDLDFKIWDYITVGAFSLWKRQDKICAKLGPRMAVGQIQKGNMGESINIVGNLLLGGCMVSDMVLPETLAKMYNASKVCYIPAGTIGGGERAVLEARACGIDVEIEPDNEKLKELLTSPIWDDRYYAKQLKEGLTECIS